MWSVAPSFEPFLLTLYPKTNIERSGEMENAFSEVVGQQDVIRRLVQTACEDRVPQALLFCGAPGVGKLALAMGFAAYLLSEGTPSLPVTAPNARAMLRLWEHPDLHFTFPTIKKAGSSSDYKPVSDDYAKPWHELIMRSPYFTIEQWLRQMGATTQQGIITAREGDELLRKLSLKSSLGGYKVSIIWLPERARAEFSNGILKLLEEPPQHTVFMLVSEEPNLLLDTIRSRTQRIDVKAIDEAELVQALRDRRGLDDETARQTAHVAQGSWLQAMQLLSPNNENTEFFEMFQSLMRLCYMRRIGDLKAWSQQAAEMGREKEKRMLTYFIEQVRENFMYNFHIPELCYQSREEAAFSRNFARYINERNVIEISELFATAIRDIGQNANGKIVFFDMALKLIVLILR